VIPMQVQNLIFLFVIQVSHALAFAHSNGLTHNAFDLS
jgi:hypothetical protein